jgi:hypothetical protein
VSKILEEIGQESLQNEQKQGESLIKYEHNNVPCFY